MIVKNIMTSLSQWGGAWSEPSFRIEYCSM